MSQRDKAPCHTTKTARNNLKNTTKSSRCRPGLQTPQIPLQLSICGTFLEHARSRESPPSNPQDRKDPLQTSRCQTPQNCPRSVRIMPRRVRTVLADIHAHKHTHMETYIQTYRRRVIHIDIHIYIQYIDTYIHT